MRPLSLNENVSYILQNQDYKGHKNITISTSEGITLEQLESAVPWFFKGRSDNAVVVITKDYFIWGNGEWQGEWLGTQAPSQIRNQLSFIWQNGSFRGQMSETVFQNGDFRGYFYGKSFNGNFIEGVFIGGRLKGGKFNGDFDSGTKGVMFLDGLTFNKAITMFISGALVYKNRLYTPPKMRLIDLKNAIESGVLKPVNDTYIN